MKTVIHNGQTCIFDEEKHIYIVNGQRLISGTQLVKKFFPQPDWNEVANETAEKRGTTPEALLAEWKEKGERAGQEGRLVHSYAEWMHDPNSDPGRPPYAIETDRVGRLTVQLLKACDKLCEKYFEPIEAEKIIFSTQLGLAGTIDLLLKDFTGKIIILDWKTNEELTTTNPFQTGLPPIDHLEDANLNHYALQLSTYQYVLETEEYFPAGQEFKRMIIHLTEDDHILYTVKYLKDEVEEMLI